jgi:20S proteasome alpha/beta subunit
MTVCIAAICGLGQDEGPYVVAAADRMITIGNLEYEPAQTKTVQFASTTIGLFSGAMELHAAVIPKVYERISNHFKDENKTIMTSMIAEFYAEEFSYYRRAMAEREILFPRGLTLEKFYSSRQSLMAHYQVDEIDNDLLSYYLDSCAIICGLDPTGAHIYVVRNPGKAECFDTPFFAAIGAGEPLATSQFMLSKFDKTWDLARALWLAYSAKIKAQAAGGVGNQSDLIVISGKHGIVTLSERNKAFLSGLLSESTKKEEMIFLSAAQQVDDHLANVAAEIEHARQPDPALEQQERERLGTNFDIDARE